MSDYHTPQGQARAGAGYQTSLNAQAGLDASLARARSGVGYYRKPNVIKRFFSWITEFIFRLFLAFLVVVVVIPCVMWFIMSLGD
ncbi:hypothetical protein GTQ99_00510 [Kineococcus sp. T13]|uniref:hypothetical protein n=1 Tax=Kineococcus vitellinus TaxID=2696565 RepID=UPI001412B28A|nr:hypothetical protein [Kineococcus vitellinus]NAZ73913.1 hypothetical protein [Kineococcus vitellinus]